jgi:predicted DNA binding CopG/RHH family protein
VGEMRLNFPRDKKERRVTLKLDHEDIRALEKGMSLVGEKNMSSYIRRLIHEHKESKK